MTSTYGSLNIALRGLLAMQRAINTTAHNVSNASTDGFSRQRVVLSASDPTSYPSANTWSSYGQVGTGVLVTMVERYTSSYLTDQICDETTALSGWEVCQDVLEQMEVIFGEPSDTGISASLSGFWDAWQDLADSPENTSARTLVVETADSLSSTLREAYGLLTGLQSELDTSVGTLVSNVNDIAYQIANLNRSIVGVQASGQKANDLLDERDRLVDELSGIVEVEAFGSDTGSLTVSLGGRLLVMDTTVSKIAVSEDAANGNMNSVVWADTGKLVTVQGIALGGGLAADAAGSLSGKLGATFVARDLIVPEYLNELDEIASALIDNVNALQLTGYGLGGSTGGGVVASEVVSNTVAGFSLADPATGNSALADGTYYVEIRDNNGMLEFRVVDSDGEAQEVVDAAAGDGSLTNQWQTLDLVDGTSFDTGRGLVVDFAAIADHSLAATTTDANVSGFTLSGVTEGTSELADGTYFVEVRDNGGEWQFRLVDSAGDAVGVYDAAAADGSLTDNWQTIPSGSLEFDTARGMTIEFSGGPYEETSFGDVPAPASFAYTARDTHVGGIGEGAANATLAYFFSGASAQDIAVSDYMIADTNRIATAASPDSPGDGSVAAAIADLAEALLVNGGTATIGDYFGSAIGRLGTDAREASEAVDHHTLLSDDLKSRLQEIAGVSLDEETVNLVEYQRTYQAAARVMTAMDEMLETIINNLGVVGR